MKAGIIGCGVISEIYLKNLTERYANPEIVACADLFMEKARERAEQFGIQAMTVDEMMADPQIDLILNLTTPLQHAEISLRALENGKHVYCEKPLAVSVEDGRRIMEKAAEKGLQVGCAPDTFLGAGVQTALKALRDGWIGQPVAAVGFFSCRGHERWHGNPGFYYQKGGGPHFDMGPYYLTALCAAFGRVKRVNALSRRTFPERLVTASGPNHGKVIPVEVDTHLSVSLEFDCGVIATMMLSFDVWSTDLPCMEFYGTAGTISVPDPNFFEGPVKLRSLYDEEAKELPLVNPYHENARGIGLAQMCQAIEKGEPVCAGGQQGLHVLEVIEAIDRAGRTGECVEIESGYTAPELLPQGRLEPEYKL
ncbi:MAG: Gfo/Idh/MocA family oxidoreductase [Lachnospiraceae bacterium]|nr:Gfo/Idh/MocA family oxidoreductase [Lachnospiraceae bacterium]